MDATFIPGLELSKLFYQEEVRPILDKYFPHLKYSAGLFGWGSEVLGYDTEISRDHHWGPRVLLFLNEDDFLQLEKTISKTLADNLPYTFRGYSTNFSAPDSGGVRNFAPIDSGPVNHMILVFTIKSFWEHRLGVDPYQNLTSRDWLILPQLRLLEMTSGDVFYDGLNELQKIRQKFNYFPVDVWLYLMAAQWNKISQEEAFVGRNGDVRDELGSGVIASRIVHELMMLCFLLEKKYYPYSKWFGAGFNKLDIAQKLNPILRKVLLSEHWKEREEWLSKAYSIVTSLHNSLHITEKIPTETTSYHERPYLVIHADTISEIIRQEIKDTWLRDLKTDIGSIDQFTDNTYISMKPKISQKLKIIYDKE